MARVAAALLVFLVGVATAGSAVGADRTGYAPPTKTSALKTVRAVVAGRASKCQHRLVRLDARPARPGWLVTAVVRGRRSGASTWRVRSRRAVAVNPLARHIAAGCPVPPVPPEPPPQPPAPPRATAPATYVFGPEITAAQQDALRTALDIGTAVVQGRLGRQVPAFTVWAHTDLEALIATYMATNGNTAESARATWSQTWAAAGNGGRTWWGPRWFEAREVDRVKVAVHELVHVVQTGLLGSTRLGGGDTEVPPAGPRWLAEGMAEWLAWLGAETAGLARFADMRRQWVGQLGQTSTRLVAFETLVGFRETPQAWALVSLAVELLARSRGEASLLSYYEAVGAGTPWRDAFSSVFGRPVENFYEEFEAFRRAP